MTTARVFWFTGLSGVGKTTIAKIANFRLQKMGLKVLVLDGDVVGMSYIGILDLVNVI